MGTRNATSSSNNANFVLWSYSTAMDYTTDRNAGTVTARSIIKQLQNLGVTVTKTSSGLFTNLTS